MRLFSTRVLPIDKMLIGQSAPIGEIVENARNYPVHFALELFAFVMMIVGAIVTCTWAYDLGKIVGTAIG